MRSSHEWSWWVENAAKYWGLFPFHRLKLFPNIPACFIEVENSEIYRVTGTKSADRGCFPFLVKEQQFHLRYGPPLLAKLTNFHNPNNESRVVHSMHNWMFHCHLGICTCHLTYRSFPRLSPHSCPKAWCFQQLQHTHQSIWTQVC
jgi:hypothetical protein